MCIIWKFFYYKQKILYLENSKYSTKKTLDTIETDIYIVKWRATKMNTQKFMTFMYANNEIEESETV